MSEYEHSAVEFANEQLDISVDTDGDDLYEVEEEIESSFDLETSVASSECFVAITSIPHIFAGK